MSVKIIAEIAQGYEGKVEQALLLARAGAACGADAVKFQCVYADDISVPTYKHYEFFKTLEMPISVWQQIAEFIHNSKQELIINVGGEQSLEVSTKIGADAVKLHATSFFCNELIHEALQKFAKVYISVGGLTPEEIEQFISYHSLKPGKQVAFTYGFQASPTPLEKNNLRKLGAFVSRFSGFDFGFEDHTDAASPDRLVVPLMALPFGVQHLEKHLTLDTCLNLEDSESALSPSDFKLFVDMVRRIEPTLGVDDLSLTDIENDYRKRVLKVSVAATGLNAGTVLGPDNTVLKRIAEPSQSGFISREGLYGKIIMQNVPIHAQILGEMFEQ